MKSRRLLLYTKSFTHFCTHSHSDGDEIQYCSGTAWQKRGWYAPTLPGGKIDEPPAGKIDEVHCSMTECLRQTDQGFKPVTHQLRGKLRLKWCVLLIWVIEDLSKNGGHLVSPGFQSWGGDIVRFSEDSWSSDAEGTFYFYEDKRSEEKRVVSAEDTASALWNVEVWFTLLKRTDPKRVIGWWETGTAVSCSKGVLLRLLMHNALKAWWCQWRWHLDSYAWICCLNGRAQRG